MLDVSEIKQAGGSDGDNSDCGRRRDSERISGRRPRLAVAGKGDWRRRKRGDLWVQ